MAPNASSTTNPNPVLASASWSQPHTAFITAFDVSVLSGSSFVTGRLFTNIFAANMGGANNGFNGRFNVLTSDGYIYTVNNNGQAGFGFSFFVNNKGHRTATGEPSYLSVDDLSAINVHDPRAADTETDITHKIFFNTPSSALPASAPVAGGGTTWLLTTPDVLVASGIVFRGVEGTVNMAGTNPAGGNFTFNSQAATNFALDIDINRDGDFTDGVDRRLTGTAVIGSNTIYWDGKDGQGAVVAPYSAATNVRVILFGGEVHFPFIDVENNVNGIIITRTNGANPNSIVNWDDTPITATGTPSSLAARRAVSKAHHW